MEEVRHSKRRSHDGKTGYPTPAAALLACIDWKREHLRDLWPYKCRHCTYYHIGNIPPEVHNMALALIGV